jgi:hypothetical protein
MNRKTELRVEEWKCSMENARHFNDLLMRLRMLGLPIVITLAAAGIAANAFDVSFEIPIWPLPMITFLLALFGLISLVWHTIIKLIHKDSKHLEFSWLEFIVWIIFLALLVVPTYAFRADILHSFSSYLNHKDTYSVTPFALLASVTLLIAIYLMDRFYYFKLLIAAVCRSAELEKTFDFRVTYTTCNIVPEKISQNLVTLFYCIPGIVLLSIALLLLL